MNETNTTCTSRRSLSTDHSY